MTPSLVGLECGSDLHHAALAMEFPGITRMTRAGRRNVHWQTWLLSVVVSLAGLLLPAIVQAEELLNLVGDDAAACLHVRDFSRHRAGLESSELITRLKQSPFVRDWLESDGYRQVDIVRRAIEAASGQPLNQSVEELLGQEFAVALYTVPGGTPDVVLLLNARSDQAIQRALDTWSQLDPQQTVQQTWRGFACVRSTGHSKATVWYARTGTTLIVAQSESRLHDLLGRWPGASGKNEAGGAAVTGAAGNSADDVPEGLRAAVRRRNNSEVASVYVNPRAWDSHLAQPQDAAGRAILSLWKRFRCVTLRLRHEQDLMLELTADYDPQGLPDAWRDWSRQISTSRLPLDQIPDDDVVFAAAGRFPAPQLAELIRQYLPTGADAPRHVVSQRRLIQGLLLGLDPIDDVLPGFGPHWLAWVVARQPAESATFPVDVILAVERVQQNDDSSAANATLNSTTVPAGSSTEAVAGEEPAPAGDKPSRVDQALHNLLIAGLNVLSAAHNTRTSQEISTLHRRTYGNSTVYWAEPVATVRPAGAILAGHLLLATSPELCARFLTQNSDLSAGAPSETVAEPTSRDARNPMGAVQTLMVNSSAARELLSQHEDWFQRQAERDGLSREEFAQRLSDLHGLLNLMDSAWLTASLGETSASLTLGLTAEAR